MNKRKIITIISVILVCGVYVLLRNVLKGTYAFYSDNKELNIINTEVGDWRPKGNYANLKNLYKFGTSEYYQTIIGVYFVNNTDTSNAAMNGDNLLVKDITDITSGTKAGSTTAWLEINKNENSKYDLYIGSNEIIKTKTLLYAFSRLYNVKIIDFNNMLDTSEVTSMEYAFYTNATYSNTDRIDRSHLKTISGIENWNLNNVTDMSHMFEGSAALNDLSFLSNWNTDNVTDMSYMFQDCIQFSNFNILSDWDISGATNLKGMFQGCTNLSDISWLSTWKVSNIKNFSSMFSGCTNLNDISAISNWDMSGATSLSGMFKDCTGINSIESLAKWNFSEKTNLSSMFSGCTSLTNIDFITNWEYGWHIDESMFENCSGLVNMNLPNMKVLSLTNVFKGCSGLKSINLSGWDLSDSTITAINLFALGISYASDINLSNWILSPTINKISTGGLASVVNIDMGNWNTENVTSLKGLFDSCQKLETFNITGWNTSNVKDMSNMFRNDSVIKKIDLSFLNTSKVTTMALMFDHCSVLEEIDMSNCETPLLGDTKQMFYYARKVKTLRLDNFITNKITSYTNMFTRFGSSTSPGTIYISSGGLDFINSRTKEASYFYATVTPV